MAESRDISVDCKGGPGTEPRRSTCLDLCHHQAWISGHRTWAMWERDTEGDGSRLILRSLPPVVPAPGHTVFADVLSPPLPQKPLRPDRRGEGAAGLNPRLKP